ncbi:MAG: sulfatase [Chloroflexota bacterium]|nr:sulfatase [Chloroflexota bacterium]
MREPLSVILIQIDSLNRHFLPVYGNSWVQAPNLTAFARDAAVFQHHYVGSLPCMPARREIWTGTEELWWRGWGPLEPWDQTIAYLAGRHGITTNLITDHYHLFEWGSHSYPYDYAGYSFIRGHEYDNWRTDPVSSIPGWAEQMVSRIGDAAQIYLRNTQSFTREEHFFAPRVMQATSDWLDRNWQQPQFFLHVDCFDVHEPFHIPEPYRSLYTDDDYRRYSPWPRYGHLEDERAAISADELQWVRAQFAGKLTMVDTWLERVFDRLERYKLWDRTCVIVTTDHGHYLGEHGWIGKPDAPLYHTLSHIPLLVRHPYAVGQGVNLHALTQTVDLYATILEVLGVPVPDTSNIHSRSFAPVLLGKTDTHRDHVVYGYNNQSIGITTHDWTLLRDHDGHAAAPYAYTHQVDQVLGRSLWMRHERPAAYPNLEAGYFIPGVDMPVWKTPTSVNRPRVPRTPRPDLLFDNRADAKQEQDLATERPDMVTELAKLLRDHTEAVSAPLEQQLRLRLQDNV